VSAYQTAINLTTLTIDRRANNYRNLVVAVVLVSLGSIGWAIFAPSLSALSGFFLLLPVCGLYLFIDGKLLNDWRSRLLEGWVRGEIDFQAFCQAVDAIPTLPKSTLQGMIATLPSAGDLLHRARDITHHTRGDFSRCDDHTYVSVRCCSDQGLRLRRRRRIAYGCSRTSDVATASGDGRRPGAAAVAKMVETLAIEVLKGENARCSTAARFQRRKVLGDSNLPGLGTDSGLRKV